MAPPNNPNNWHWVDRSVYDWTRQWFDETLPKISAEDGDTSVKINKVIRMSDKDDDGHDILLMQTKGNPVVIFEISLVLGFSATAPEEDDIAGEINVVEFDHDTKEDQFEFGVTVNSKSAENRERVKDLIRSKIEPQLRAQLRQLIPTISDVHLGSIKNKVTKASESSAAPKQTDEKTVTTPVQRATTGIVNTATLTDQEEFRTTAEELFRTFTEEARLAAFTRAHPKVFEGAKKGGKFELFDGNVAGEYLELNEPTRIVQSWRLKQWPAGHYSRQDIEFVQNDDDGVTVMRVTWTGVPLGQEEVTKENWGEYYVRSIKRTFGFGTIL